ncbi:hypothetical protein [Acidaminobacterium chupaoyuni]
METEKKRTETKEMPAVTQMPQESGTQENGKLLEELRGLRARQREWVFREDLQKIKKAFPEADIETVIDLGDDFLKMRSVGIDPVVAYCAITAAREAGTPAAPPAIGSVEAQGPGEKEYFTPAEVKRMNPEQIKKNLRKIEKSQKKW